MESRPYMLMMSGVPFLGKFVARFTQTDPILGHITPVRHVVPISNMMCVELAILYSTFPTLVLVSLKDRLPESFANFLLFAHSLNQ